MTKSVTGLADKVGMLIDAVSGNIKQVDAHGKSLEVMGMAVTGLRSSVDSFIATVRRSGNTATPSIDSPFVARAGSPSGESLDVSSEDEEEGPRKARRVGPGAAGVRTTPNRKEGVSRAKEQAEARVKGMHDVIAVRRSLSDALPGRIGAATTCSEVYSDVGTFSELVTAHTISTLGLSRSEAVTWLMTHVQQPSKGKATDGRADRKRAGATEPGTVRPIKLLKAVLPHLMESLKKRILPIYFAALGLDMNTLTLITVMKWLIKNEYTDSPLGRKAICECLVSLFDFLGKSDRVETLSVGSGRVIRASIGHYALVSGFVRYFLEGLKDKLYRERALAASRQRRTGAEPGVYIYFRAELLRVNVFLDTDNEAHDGLVLEDGADASRAQLNTPENDQAATTYNRQQILEINYPSQLATLVAEEAARDRAAEAVGRAPA